MKARIRYIRRLTVFTVTVILVIAIAGSVGSVIYIFDAVTAISTGCADSPNRPNNFAKEGYDLSPYFMEMYETVSFRSRSDRVKLNGWYVPVENSIAAVIVVHGSNSCKNSLLSLTNAGMLHKSGYNVLIMDLRNHGESEVTNSRHTAGSDEYKDVLGAWDWLVEEQGYEPSSIGLHGFSLGAATAIIAAGEEPLVAAVWADSSFATIEDVGRERARLVDAPEAAGLWTLALGQAIFQIDLSTKSPADAIQRFDGRPIYLVHGAGDNSVDAQNSVKLGAAVGVTPWILDNVGHVGAIWAATEEYERRMVAFFDAALNQLPAN